MGRYHDDRGTDILGLINEGESQTLELRSRLGSPSSIAPTVSAFANTEGGYIVIGVDPEGRPTGLRPAEIDKASLRLLTVMESMLQHPAETETINADGLILFSYVTPASEEFRPVTTAEGRAYIRRGARNLPLKREETTAPRSATTPKKAFIAMSFRTEEEPALVDYQHAILRAIKETGLPIEPIRMDLLEGDYEISQELMNRISECDFMIADFTLNPANVYFETGYARGATKPIIQTARTDTTLEFDTRNWRTRFYRNATELEVALIPAIENAYHSVADSP